MEYRHQCHVGDHGDALKHPVLAALIQSLAAQHASLNIIDTHAGTGCYDLMSAPDNHAAEFKEGVGHLWESRDRLPTSFHAFLNTLTAFNRGEKLTLYPGSAVLGFQQGRPQDAFHFSDIQPDEAALLQTNIEQIRSDLHISSTLSIFSGDGLKALPLSIETEHSHHLIVIDPPYEQDDEYTVVIEALCKAYKRNEKVTAMIWYPLYTEDKSALILQRSLLASKEQQLPVPMQAELRLRDPKDDDRLIGSGLLLFNPPAGIAALVAEVLEYLHCELATKGEGYWQVKSLSC